LADFTLLAAGLGGQDRLYQRVDAAGDLSVLGVR